MWTAPDVNRVEPSYAGATEREALQGWLDYHRQTLLWKCRGLTADQLKTASADPSNLTLLGLVRHMAEVERSWFRRRIGAQDVPPIYFTDDNPDGDFDLIADADAEADFAVFADECRLADEAVKGKSLEDTFIRQGVVVDVRWVYMHMIEEYARHNGHADLIREGIDGNVGD